MKLSEKMFIESNEGKDRLLKSEEDKNNELRVLYWIDDQLHELFFTATKKGVFSITFGVRATEFFENYVYPYLIEQGFIILNVNKDDPFEDFYTISWNK